MKKTDIIVISKGNMGKANRLAYILIKNEEAAHTVAWK